MRVPLPVLTPQSGPYLPIDMATDQTSAIRASPAVPSRPPRPRTAGRPPAAGRPQTQEQGQADQRRRRSDRPGHQGAHRAAPRNRSVGAADSGAGRAAARGHPRPADGEARRCSTSCAEAAGAPADIAPAAPADAYTFEDHTIYDTHNGLLRFLRKLLDADAQAVLQPQSDRGGAQRAGARQPRGVASAKPERERTQAEWNALHYTVLQRLVTEVVATSASRCRACRCGSNRSSTRVDFNERRDPRTRSAAGAHRRRRPAPSTRRPLRQVRHGSRPTARHQRQHAARHAAPARPRKAGAGAGRRRGRRGNLAGGEAAAQARRRPRRPAIAPTATTRRSTDGRRERRPRGRRLEPPSIGVSRRRQLQARPSRRPDEFTGDIARRRIVCGHRVRSPSLRRRPRSNRLRHPSRHRPTAAPPARPNPPTTVKLAVVVQRYGADIGGGSELHARYIAEHLAAHADVRVLTTCARDYVTWRNEYPAGEDRVNGIPVERFAVARERDPRDFARRSSLVFDEHALGGGRARVARQRRGR